MKNLFTSLLNKLNALKFDKLEKKQIFLIVLVGVVILYVDFAFIMKLQLRGIRTLTPKIIKLKKDIDSLTKDLSGMQDLEQKAGQNKTQIGALKPREIISQDKILLLLQEISDLANKNHVKITQINTSKDSKVQEEVIAEERLLPIIVNLNLSCGYHALGSFMNDLENARQFIELEEMKIIRDPHNYLLQNVNLVLKIYAKK